MRLASSSSSSLQCLLAAAASETKMSSFRPYPRGGGGGGGGRRPGGRGFCNRPPPTGDREEFITGDSHIRSVQDANYGFRQGGGGGGGNFNNSGGFQRQYYRQPYRPPPPPSSYQPRPKPWDYRNWEYALSQPPSECERFVVLSYNILADYLALDHRRELYYHLPLYILDWEWRKRRILFELGLWSADIMCLQEVDRFQDLENELKLHGYDGIWKMRTGKPVDGCAIFWRTRKFKLRHEESIEFRDLGLRDNVAQICVFESRTQNPTDNVSADSPTSSGDVNQVVVCNTHVLYNPRRGEIKLGQVRGLLDRAHAVSKLWNDAPVVLCGDFNCTPKSPLYNFISEQRLNLVGLARDQLSGQSSAEIHRPKPYNPNPRVQFPDNSVGNPGLVDVNQGNHLPNMHNNPNTQSDVENSSLTNNLAQPQNVGQVVDTSMRSGSTRYETENRTICDTTTKEPEEEVVDGSKDGVQESLPPVDSSNVNHCLENESPLEETSGGAYAIYGTSYEHSQSNLSTSNLVVETTQEESVEVSSPEMAYPSTSCRSTYDVEISDASTCINLTVDQKLGNLSLRELGEVTEEDGSLGQDHVNTSSSDRHSTEEVSTFDVECGSNLIRPESSEADQPSEECAATLQDSHLPSPSAEVDSSPSIDSESANVERYFYDPSSWTPMEIETATGNPDCTFLEHPLKLKSTYAEVEDYSGTRDLESREPQVTSYNRRFLGTVDYIWCTEGLQTVKVLDTIPKEALRRWTTGFPTKKWGSDHIALASQLAFKKDVDKS